MRPADGADPRAADASRILSDLGLSAVSVTPGGPEGEVAVVRAPRSEWTRLLAEDASAAVDAVKKAGFRYVALDLEPGPAGV